MKSIGKSIFVILIVISILIGLVYIFNQNKTNIFKEKNKISYIASDSNSVKLCEIKIENDEKKLECSKDIVRGKKVINTSSDIVYEDDVFTNIIVGGREYYVNKDNLVDVGTIIAF